MSRDYIAPPATLAPGAVVWASLRDSGGSGQELSISQQRDEVTRYCQRYSLLLLRVFADEGKSGTTDEGRDDFLRMIEQAADPDQCPAGILFWNFARSGRNLDDTLYYKARLRKLGIIVHSLTDPIPEGEYGRVVEVIIDIANEEKSRQTSRDVRRGLHSLIRQGFSAGGFPPRGYKAEQIVIGHKRDGTPREVSRWVEDEALWEVCKLAWAMRAEGKPHKAINEATGGRVYKTSSCWTTFFRNKTYLGIGKCGNLEIPNHHPAMIDVAIWEAVQKVQDASRASNVNSPHHPRRKGSPHLLSGLAVCIHCGDAVAFDISGRWPCYICGRKRRQEWKSCEGRTINARLADANILGAVAKQVLTEEYALALLEDVRAQLADTAPLDLEAARLQQALAECERKLHHLNDQIENFGAARSTAKLLQEREGEHSSLQAELKRLEAKRAAAEVEVTPEALSMALAVWRGEFAEAQRAGDVVTLKNFLRRFVAKIELGYNRARLHYTYPLDGFHGNAVPLRGGTG